MRTITPPIIRVDQMLPGKYPRALALTSDGNTHLVDIKEVRACPSLPFLCQPFLSVFSPIFGITY